MFKRKKKKTGCKTPEYRCPTMPPVIKPKEIDINHLEIRTLEAIRIETHKYDQIASIEFSALSSAINPIVSINSSSVEQCNFAGKIFDTKSLSFRDAFTPGSSVILTGIFMDWISGELIYGEYDLLNYKFTRKEN